MKKGKSAGRKRAALIGLYILGMLAVAGLYGADVLLWKNPPAKNLPKALTVFLLLAVSLFRLLQTRRKNLAAVEQLYGDKIGRAFAGDRGKKRALLSALVDYNQNDRAACIGALTELLEKSATVEERRVVRYFMALCYKDGGVPEKAAALYREILAETPNYAPALSNLSVICYDRHEYKEAIDLAQQALDCDRSNPYAYDNLAGAYARVYELERAKEYARQALELKKDLYPASTLLSILSTAEGDALSARRYAELAVASGQDADRLASAAREYKAQYAHHRSIEAHLAAWREKTGVPSIPFTLDRGHGKSIIGGQINEPAPISAKGREMRLLAAFFCSELPKNELLPPRGVLRFYITPDDYYGASLDGVREMNVQKEFRVLFDEDELSFSTTPYRGDGDEAFPVYGSYRPRFTLEREGMPLSDFRYEETMERVLEDGGEDAGGYQDKDFRQGISPFGHKLGGYPWFTQEDPRSFVPEYRRYDTLLFQLDTDCAGSDVHVMFGDGGVCNFFIPREKLKRRDFSDILYTWDCF